MTRALNDYIQRLPFMLQHYKIAFFSLPQWNHYTESTKISHFCQTFHFYLEDQNTK